MSSFTKAVAYLRVSDISQISGTGFERQAEAIKSYSKGRNFSIICEYKESHTGTEGDRPVFNEMIKELFSNHCRVVIVERLDRLARDLSVQMNLLALLIRHGITLFSASTGQNVTEDIQSDPMLKTLIQIQGTFAELEKSLLVAKLKKARKLKKEKTGRCEGKKPFGYYEGEEETLRLIKKLYRKPHNEKRLGYYVIARILNEKGVPTRTGVLWNGMTIKGILKRKNKY